MRTSNRDRDLLALARRRGYLDDVGQRQLELQLDRGGSAAELLVVRCGLHPATVRDLQEYQRRRSVPARIGGYRISGEIGRGGMGLVYRADRLAGGEPVAIKVLSPKQVGDRVRVGRFLREISMTRAVTHPGLVACHETGVVEGKPYLVLEYMPGGDLGRAGPMPEAEALTIIAACARGAQAIADAGWVHRDIKPGNVMLAADGSAKLGDFGLAKAVEAEQHDELTRQGFCVGTPAYIAPEVARTGQADARSDVYALGATLYHLLTGRAPYRGANPAALLQTIARGDGPEPLPRSCSAAVRTIVTTAMAHDPRHRYACGAGLAEDCERVLDGGRVRGVRGSPLTWLLTLPARLGSRLRAAGRRRPVAPPGAASRAHVGSCLG